MSRRFAVWMVALTVVIALAAGVWAIRISLARGAHLSDILPYASLVGGVCALLGVWWNLAESGRRRDEDLARTERLRLEDIFRNEAAARHRTALERNTAKMRFLGCAKSVRTTLSFVYQTARMPIYDFSAIDRFVEIAYGNDVADLATDFGVATEYFDCLTRFEYALAMIRYVQRVDFRFFRLVFRDFGFEPTGLGRKVEENAILAAKDAARQLDAMRAAFGETDVAPEFIVRAHQLARSVRDRRQIDGATLPPATPGGAPRDLLSLVNKLRMRKP